VLGAGRAVERFHVRLQLDQVARHEARGEPEMAQCLHQQPAGVAARSGRAFERLLRRLHARFEADQIADLALQPLVQIDEEIDRASLSHVDARQPLAPARRQRLLRQVRQQVVMQSGLVRERILLGRRLEKEVERVVHRHLRNQIDRDFELGRLVGKHEPRQVVGERILLPVDEVVVRLDPQRIRQDRRSRVRRRPQSHDLRRQADAPVVAVVGDVVECDVDRHA
jgi:hypothetical protein